MNHNENRSPTLAMAVSILIIVLIWMIVGIVALKLNVQMVIFIAIIAVSLVCYFGLHNSVDDIIENMASSVGNTVSGLFFFFLIGMAIAIWMISGCLPAVVYYGMKLMNPVIFLPITFVLSSIFSLCTGSAWTTAGTIGIVCFGIGMTLGIPDAMTVGAVVSGAYFGDKMSPVSDSTTLAPISSGTDVFSHIRAMLHVTVPAYVIAFIMYLAVGFRFQVSGGNIQAAIDLEQAILDHFDVNPFVLLPLLLVVALSVMRKPAIPTLLAGIVVAVPIALIFQHQTFTAAINCMASGVSLDIENEIVAKIVNRGGISSMMGTLSIVMIALAFGGLMSGSGIFPVVLDALTEKIKNPRAYPAIVILTSGLLVIATSSNYVPLTLSGKMFGKAYDDVGLDRSMLSRNIEEGATITAVLCPWASSAVYYVGVFGVPVMAYFPYSFLNILTVVMGCLLPLCGLTLVTKEGTERGRKVSNG